MGVQMKKLVFAVAMVTTGVAGSHAATYQVSLDFTYQLTLFPGEFNIPAGGSGPAGDARSGEIPIALPIAVTGTLAVTGADFSLTLDAFDWDQTTGGNGVIQFRNDATVFSSINGSTGSGAAASEVPVTDLSISGGAIVTCQPDPVGGSVIACATGGFPTGVAVPQPAPVITHWAIDIGAGSGFFSSYRLDSGTTPPAHSINYTITSITASEVPVPAGVWLFTSALIGLVGAGRRGRA